MRGEAGDQLPLFHVFEVDDRIRPDHPMRDIKRHTDRILAAMGVPFAAAYSRTGRPGVPPERLLKALLLMVLYSIRSERQSCEAIDLHLLVRWFLGLQPGDEAFDVTTFTKDRQRPDDHGRTKSFFDAVVVEALIRGPCSEHVSVDGTLIESLASAKSFQPGAAAGGKPRGGDGFKPRNAGVDFHGQKRTNETHASTTDPEAKLYRESRGQGAELSRRALPAAMRSSRERNGAALVSDLSPPSFLGSDDSSTVGM